MHNCCYTYKPSQYSKLDNHTKIAASSFHFYFFWQILTIAKKLLQSSHKKNINRKLRKLIIALSHQSKVSSGLINHWQLLELTETYAQRATSERRSRRCSVIAQFTNVAAYFYVKCVAKKESERFKLKRLFLNTNKTKWLWDV